MRVATPSSRLPARRTVRLGFVELIDAAAVIAADALGYFAEEGLDVVLSREIGWANVRDKLSFRRLDAAATLIGMPLRSVLRASVGETAGDAADDDTAGYPAGEPLRAVMALGTGGDAITLSRRLVAAGVTSGTLLAEYVRRGRGVGRGIGRGTEPPRLAHVFESSVHHYLLRDWLAASGLDPDRDVRLCVLPPTQTVPHLADGRIDGYCVGEPWNTAAQDAGTGRIIALTSDLVPAHPDKVLAVNAGWADRHADTVVALIRALLRASAFCGEPANAERLAGLLTRPGSLDADRQTVRRSLALGAGKGDAHGRPAGWAMRSFTATFPSHTHAAWLVTQMQRWGHAPASADPGAVAARATDAAAYRQAAAETGVICPDTDAPPMPLRSGKVFAAPLSEGVLV